jgi:hypothetical protein
MFGRRLFLAGIAAAAAASRWMGAAAAAVPQSGRRDNCSFVQESQSSLRQAIARGEAPPDARLWARCPLCGERIGYSSDRLF